MVINDAVDKLEKMFLFIVHLNQLKRSLLIKST